VNLSRQNLWAVCTHGASLLTEKMCGERYHQVIDVVVIYLSTCPLGQAFTVTA
jgi:hypothetical protein